MNINVQNSNIETVETKLDKNEQHAVDVIED